MEFQVVMVTPEKARTWLETGGKNRKLSLPHAARLAEEMKNGKWRLTNQTIGFSADGSLIDGQHRLNAVIMSGASVPMPVVFGIQDPGAFKAIDSIARKRQAVDLFSIIKPDGKNINAITAAAKRLLLWDRTSNKREFSLVCGAFNALTPDEVSEYAEANYREISSGFKCLHGAVVYKRCKAPSALLAALVLCTRENANMTIGFAHQLKTGTGLSENSPVYLLREKLSFPPVRSSGLGWQTEVMALTIKCWNYFAEDKPLKKLRWIQDSEKPEGFPIPKGA